MNLQRNNAGLRFVQLLARLHTGPVHFNKSGRLMMKLINGGKKKRSAWQNFSAPSPSLPTPSSFSKGSQSNRRVVVLNKLFMKAVTDLMTTGQCSSLLTGLGIEVTKVKVGSEINIVNVFWLSHSNIPVEQVQSILNRAAGVLCQELTSLNLIGKMPEIRFVRERSQGSWADVDALLKTADLGEDYEPVGLSALKSEFYDQEHSSKSKDDLPVMRQNVYGLDREAVIERIRSSMRGKPRKLQSESPPNADNKFQFAPFDQEAFHEFLLKQKIDKERIMRTERSEPVVYNDEIDDQLPWEEDDFLEEDEYENDEKR